MAKSWRNGWCEEQPHPIDVRSGVSENSSVVPFLGQRITLFNLWRWYQSVFQSSCLWTAGAVPVTDEGWSVLFSGSTSRCFFGPKLFLTEVDFLSLPLKIILYDILL